MPKPTPAPHGEVKIRLPVLHPGQEQVLAEARRFNVLCCGRRWGKSLFGIDRIIDTPGLGIVDGKPCGWFAATNKLLVEAWALAKEVLSPITKRSDAQQHRIECITGGSLEMWSLESTGCGLGRRYGVVVVDEAAIVKNLATRWRREIRPTLSDYGGSAWFATTPRGRAGDFFDLWSTGQGDDAEWKSWQMPTATNPHIQAAEIESARREYERAGMMALFEQEYLAQFVADIGLVFQPGRVHTDSHPPRIDTLFLGIDPALTASALGDGDELETLDGRGAGLAQHRLGRGRGGPGQAKGQQQRPYRMHAHPFRPGVAGRQGMHPRGFKPAAAGNGPRAGRRRRRGG
jgi:hypothetical protein